jgi:putative CocE/NonD family hydrolase
MKAALFILATLFLNSQPVFAEKPTVTDFPDQGWQDTEAGCSDTQRREPIASSIGCYRGYSLARYRAVERTSQYVAMPDGTRVAVDVFRPQDKSGTITTPLPVIFMYARYWRAYERVDGTTQTVAGTIPTGQTIFKLDDAMAEAHSSNAGGNALLLAHGYIVVRAEARGTGASFGIRNGDMSGLEAADGSAIIEWIARQPWSNGKVGMVGFSYPGMAQLLTASTKPKNLLAIMPAMATFDEYRASWAGGGVLRKYGLAWLAREARQQRPQVGIAGSTINPKSASTSLPGRVDEDKSGSLRAEALELRTGDPDAIDPTRYFTRQSSEATELIELIAGAMGTQNLAEIMELLYSTAKLGDLLRSRPKLLDRLHRLRFPRDGSAMMTQPQNIGANNLATLAPQIRDSGVAIYNWGGWRDFATLDTLLWDANLTGPKKLVVGPWAHGPNDPADRRERASAALLQIEQLRWADFWLKDVDNGIMKEDAVTLGVWDTGDRFDWLTASKYPVPGLVARKWYLTPDRDLSLEPTDLGTAKFEVDYSSTTGERTRYHGVFGGGPHAFPDLEAHAKHGAISFTSLPFMTDTLVVGSPVVSLSVTSSTPDANIHGYLERIESNGEIIILTDGVIRASHRILGHPPYANLGLPFSDSRRQIINKTVGLSPTTPEQITFDLQPIAARFRKGSRVRLVITGADANSNLTIPYFPATQLEFYMPASSLQLSIGSDHSEPE